MYFSKNLCDCFRSSCISVNLLFFPRYKENPIKSNPNFVLTISLCYRRYQRVSLFLIRSERKMGKRKGRRNNGGNKTHKNYQNKQNSFGGQHNNQMELASKFPPRTNATENGDDDDFSGCEILEEVVAQAMFEYVLEGGELDEERSTDFFQENFLGILLVKCAENEHWHIGRPYTDDGFDTSSDDDGIDFRYSNINDEAPFFKPKRQNGRPKRNHKKGHLDNPVANEVFIKMLIIQCILEEQRRRRNKRFFWKVISVFLIIVAFIIYYWWYWCNDNQTTQAIFTSFDLLSTAKYALQMLSI